MITEAKIKEYTWCDGDIDGYSRSGRWEKKIITDEEWRFIDKMISEIGLLRKDLAADLFRHEHEEKKKRFDSSETYALLKDYERKC